MPGVPQDKNLQDTKEEVFAQSEQYNFLLNFFFNITIFHSFSLGHHDRLRNLSFMSSQSFDSLPLFLYVCLLFSLSVFFSLCPSSLSISLYLHLSLSITFLHSLILPLSQSSSQSLSHTRVTNDHLQPVLTEHSSLHDESRLVW